MTSTLQVVDDALTTVLFDLNDPTGLNNAEWGGAMTEILATADLASPAIRSSTVLYSGADGGTTSFRRAGLTVSEFGMTMEATSYDNLAAGVNRLSTLLARGGVMKWIPQGSAETRYMDYEPSETPALVNGQELGLWEVIQLFSKPHGVMVRITRQPYLRGPELNSDSNELTNATLCLDRTVGAEVAPDDWTWGSVTNISNAGVTAARECFTFDIATTATRNLQQTTPNSSVTGGATYTLSAYARVVSGTNGRLQMVWQGKDNAGVNQGAEVTSTNTTLTTAWQRITVSGTMNASALKAQVSWRFANSTATSVTVDIRNVILERTATASGFYVGTETMNNDPATGKGNAIYFYNPGSAPVPVTVLLEPAASNDGFRMYVAPRSSGGVAGTNSVTTYVNALHFLQAEALTMGTNTATAVGGATFSGAGSNIALTSGWGSNSITVSRISTTISTNLDALRGGTWAILARLGSSVVATEYDVGFSYGFDSGAVYFTDPVGEAVGEMDNIQPEARNLGVFEVPTNAEVINLRFHAIRTSGTGNLRWDTFAFLSVEALGIAGNLGETGPVFGSGASGMATYPAVPEVYAYPVGSPTSPRWVGGSIGPVPFVAPPGLTGVHIFHVLDSIDTGSQTLRFVFSPRYYA